MWYNAENSNTTKPEAVDDTSSVKYVYVRKNFVNVPATEETGEHWSYQEQKVNKEDWDTYQQIITNKSDIDDVNDALIELAEIIGG